MAVKTKRNDPCHCGSGKKYKKCCLITEEAIAEGTRRAPSPESFPSGPVEGAKLILPGSVLFSGYRWRPVGKELFGRPEPETFSDFILWLMQERLDRKWVVAQRAGQPMNWHVVVRWLEEFRNLKQHPMRVASGLYVKSGRMQAVQQLAYDLFILQAVEKLPEGLVKRLKNLDQFQGARYEIAIASALARADFEIAWIGDGGTNRRCEFVARHRSSGTEIAIEAKSRQRPGVLHMGGSFDETIELKAGIRNLYESARGQGLPGKPLIIFVDLNLPTDDLPEPEPETLSLPSTSVGWSNEIKIMLQEDWAIEGRLPSPESLIVATDFCPHFGDADAVAPRGVFEFFPSPSPRNPIEDQGVMNDLFYALRYYPMIPVDI